MKWRRVYVSIRSPNEDVHRHIVVYKTTVDEVYELLRNVLDNPRFYGQKKKSEVKET